MKRFSEKLDWAMERAGLNQLSLVRAAREIDPDWKGSGHKLAQEKVARGPTAAQAVVLAKVLGVPLDWLVDDSIEGEPPAGLTEGERLALAIVRRVGVDEAVARLVGPQPGGQVGRPVETNAPARKGGRSA